MTDENKEMQPAQSKEISFGKGVTKKAIATLKRKYKKVPDFDTKEGYADGKKSLGILTKVRTGLEAERKIQVAEAIKHQTNVNTAAKLIKEEIEAIEKPIRDARKVVDDRKEKEKLEAEQAEQRRIDEIEAKVADIYAMTEGLLTADLPVLEERLAEAQAIEITEDEYMEFVEPAKLAVNNVTSTLTNAVESRRVLVKQEAEVEKQKDELKDQERKNNLKDSVQRIKMAPVDMIGKSVSDMEATLEKLNKIESSNYDDLSDDAAAAILETSGKLQAMIDQQKGIESQQADLDQQKEEQDRKEADERKKNEADELLKKQEKDREANEAALKARMPEDQKLRTWVESLCNVEVPYIEDVQLKAVMIQSLEGLADVKGYVFDNTQDEEKS